MKSVINNPRTRDLYGMDSIETTNIAMFSGGNDSIVSTHFSMNNDFPSLDSDGADTVLYIDTGVGIRENEEYVVETCEHYDWPLIVTRAEPILEELTGEVEGLEDFARRLGFPSPRTHNWIYRYLKERSLRELSKYIREQLGDDTDVRYYTGVRRQESTNRMGVVEWLSEGERWTWLAPLASWSDEMMQQYRERHDLPKSDVRQKIHRSGDCFCGAYGERQEELLLLEAHYPELYQKLMEIEAAVIEERGRDDEKAYWGWQKAEETHLKELTSDDPPMLCGSCYVDSMENAKA